jgi:hypothetical protein
MPKAKKITKGEEGVKKDETKEILLDDEEKVIDPSVDPELINGDVASEEEEDESIPDDEEIDPFKDRWEE